MRPRGGRLSRVWVVSGVVLSLTGLSLAAFGAWLAGNANCDAGDLGRQCVIASLGLSVIGAALVAGGVLRLRRVGEDGEGREAEPSAGLAERPGLVALALAVVGLVLLSLILPAPALPADVFARGAPALAASPSDLLPGEIGGAPRTGLVVAGLNRSVEAVADYADGVLLVVTRFNATTEILPGDVNNTSVEVAGQRADALVDSRYRQLDPTKGPRLCLRVEGKHWFTQDGPDRYVFAWRQGTFAFELSAPTKALRDRAAAAFAAA